MSNAPVTDIAGLIEALGGLAKAAEFFGESPQVVSNWRSRGRIPARMSLHRAALADRGIAAPLCLWNVKVPSEEAA